MNTTELHWTKGDERSQITAKLARYQEYENGDKHPVERDRAHFSAERQDAFPGTPITVSTWGDFDAVMEAAGQAAFKGKMAEQLAERERVKTATEQRIDQLQGEIDKLKKRVEGGV